MMADRWDSIQNSPMTDGIDGLEMLIDDDDVDAPYLRLQQK